MEMTLKVLWQLAVGLGILEQVIWKWKTKNIAAAEFSLTMAMIRFVFIVDGLP